MLVRSWTRSSVIPLLKAYRRKLTRFSVGVASPATIAASVGRSGPSHRSFFPPPSPKCPVSVPRSAFWKLSLNVRPMAIVSPTDFIWIVSVSSASGNFSNVQRGTLVTT